MRRPIGPLSGIDPAALTFHLKSHCLYKSLQQLVTLSEMPKILLFEKRIHVTHRFHSLELHAQPLSEKFEASYRTAPAIKYTNISPPSAILLALSCTIALRNLQYVQNF